MLLAIDVGNSNVVLALFDGETLLESWRLHTNVTTPPMTGGSPSSTWRKMPGRILRQLMESSFPAWCRL